MMNYLGESDELIAVAPAPVMSGQPLLLGSAFGVVVRGAAQGRHLRLLLKGCFRLPKNFAEAWSIGNPLFWDNTNAVVTVASAGNTRIGVAIAAAANPSSVGNVRLNPMTGQFVFGPTLDFTNPANVELFPAI